MRLRRYAVLGVSLFVALSVICGAALAATYPDREGDVKGGTGPDLVSVAVFSTKTNITFRLRFAKAPPLGLSQREGWVDMLLIGVDVPPLGPRPTTPGGEWRGANFALGTHGPSKTGQMVRTGQGSTAGWPPSRSSPAARRWPSRSRAVLSAVRPGSHSRSRRRASRRRKGKAEAWTSHRPGAPSATC